MSAISSTAGGFPRRARAGTKHDAWPLAVVAIVVAATAAGALQAASWMNAFDGPVELGFIVGMVLLVWSAIACVGAGIVLLRRRRGGAASALVIVATVAIIAVTLALHPVLGWGAGAG